MPLITIVGVGALGSHVALLMRNHRLRLIDHDKVEQKNTTAQHHGVTMVRRNKAKTLETALRHGFGATVESRPYRLTGDNAAALLGGATLVIDCVDNLAGRTSIQRYCRVHDVACLHGALSADGGFGRVVWDDVFTADAEEPGAETCQDGQRLPFFGMVAGLLGSCAQLYLDTGAQQSFELTAGSIRRIQ